jgi:hypothetical protein
MGQLLLYPWMAHPLRPGETLLDVSVQGEAWINGLVHLPEAPMVYGELGIFLVPMSALPPWFKDIFTEDVSDIDRKGGSEYLRGAAIARDDEADEGLQNIGMDERNRPWAGELATTTDSTAYVPYVSRSTFQVARDWYGLAGSVDFDDAALDDNPPAIGTYVEGARLSALSIPSASVIQDPDPTTDDSYWNMLDALFVSNTIERSYAQYLQGNSVDPRRVDGMSLPVLGQHKYFKGQDVPQFLGGYTDLSVGITDTEPSSFSNTFGAQNVGETSGELTDAIGYDTRPIGALHSTYAKASRRNIFIEEPSVLLGTFCYWVNAFQNAADNANDITYLANAGHWGDRSYGDPSEQDFLDVRQFGQAGGAILPGGPFMQNLLHLYIHGDTFFNTNGNAGVIGFRGPGGNEYGNTINLNATGKFSAQLAIASDLVGGG